MLTHINKFLDFVFPSGNGYSGLPDSELTSCIPTGFTRRLDLGDPDFMAPGEAPAWESNSDLCLLADPRVTFPRAFNYAREYGYAQFEWRGKVYHTDLKREFPTPIPVFMAEFPASRCTR